MSPTSGVALDEQGLLWSEYVKGGTVAEPWPHRGCPALMRQGNKENLSSFISLRRGGKSGTWCTQSGSGRSRYMGEVLAGVAYTRACVLCTNYAQWEDDLESISVSKEHVPSWYGHGVAPYIICEGSSSLFFFPRTFLPSLSCSLYLSPVYREGGMQTWYIYFSPPCAH